jgi:hypothetical protein
MSFCFASARPPPAPKIPRSVIFLLSIFPSTAPPSARTPLSLSPKNRRAPTPDCRRRTSLGSHQEGEARATPPRCRRKWGWGAWRTPATGCSCGGRRPLAPLRAWGILLDAADAATTRGGRSPRCGRSHRRGATEMTTEEAMSFTTARGWPSATYSMKGEMD